MKLRDTRNPVRLVDIMYEDRKLMLSHAENSLVAKGLPNAQLSMHGDVYVPPCFCVPLTALSQGNRRPAA
jgi:hypothetical protein